MRQHERTVDPVAAWEAQQLLASTPLSANAAEAAPLLLPARPDYTERLARLSSVALALTRTTNWDDFCRMAVALGLQHLGFDRLGLLFAGEELGVLYGTYGTDRTGRLRDERTFSFNAVDHPLLFQYMHEPDQRVPCLIGLDMAELTPQETQNAWQAVVGLWVGDQVIGYLFADNLLNLRPYTPEEQSLLQRYAETLGHLATHFRIEETLSQRRAAANQFLNQMSALSNVIAALTLSASFDELCYSAIDRGRRELGFDRLGLWFTTDDPECISGSYGTDEAGKIRDERHISYRFLDDDAWGRWLRRRERYIYAPGTLIPGPDGQPLSIGWKAGAALWNGEQIIGYLFTDNLLHQRPYSDNEGELLALYALLLGHLCTRQRIEEALRERETSYRTLIDAIPDYLLVITRDGLFVDYHAAQPAATEFPLAALIGKRLAEDAASPLITKCLAAIEEAFRTGEVVTWEHPLRYKKKTYHFEIRVTAGDNDRAVVLARDMTNRKLLEEQLLAAQKMESMGRMASGIAHDFNNLLTVIQGFTSVAATLAPPDATRLAGALERIRIASEKGARLTNQLLLFARKQVVQPQVLSVNEQIHAMTTLLESLLGEHIALSVSYDATAGYILMDPGQFEQILVNLAVNAHDAMPNGGCFTVATCAITVGDGEQNPWLSLPRGNYVLIEVSDTGAGMSEEIRQQIFEPFFSTKGAGKGTGLGLAICQGVVQQNGGHILVESAVGQGATFSIYLPVTTRLRAPSTPLVNHQGAAGVETILLVEDDDSVRATAVEVLSSHGYQPLACGSGREALALARNPDVDIALLLTDLIMPQMGGGEVAEQFLQLRPTIPVLLVSGYVGELPEDLVSRANVHFLPKPYTAVGLTNAVRKYINQHAVVGN
jgi:signal transduction histidine kinase/ActR/RegA family two-component response regulator